MKTYYARNRASCKARSCAWQRKNKDRHREYVVRAQYGLSLVQYRALLAKGCRICDGVARQVDHDHRTGRVRGGLCGNCNRGLGMFRDSVKLLKRAADYLNEKRVLYRL